VVGLHTRRRALEHAALTGAAADFPAHSSVRSDPVSRLARALAGAGSARLVPFLTAGYPSAGDTSAMAVALAHAGAAAIELGIPFSDPIADGPDIQRASEWALRHGVGVPEVLAVVAAIRRESEVPLVLMTYANPVLHYGASRFAADARLAGADGVLLSDLPPEELPDVWAAMDGAGLDTVMLIAPTTDPARLPLLVARARGFVYCLARTGVTGASAGERGDLTGRVAAVRTLTRLPVAVGFGIATAAQAGALRDVVDAVVVGAAFMRAIAADPDHGAVARVTALGADLLSALDPGL
jgi:tryptophan synthase alpha chain